MLLLFAGGIGTATIGVPTPAVGTGTMLVAGGGTVGSSRVGSGTITIAGGGSASGTVAVGSIIPIIMVTYRRRRSG